MIDTASAAAAAFTHGATLVQHAAELPTRLVDTARQINAVILTAPVPKVNPTEPPGGAKVMRILGWLGWGVFFACVAGVLLICIKMAMNANKNRHDGGGEEAGKLFWPLLACIIGSSAGALLGAVA